MAACLIRLQALSPRACPTGPRQPLEGRTATDIHLQSRCSSALATKGCNKEFGGESLGRFSKLFALRNSTKWRLLWNSEHSNLGRSPLRFRAGAGASSQTTALAASGLSSKAAVESVAQKGKEQEEEEGAGELVAEDVEDADGDVDGGEYAEEWDEEEDGEEDAAEDVEDEEYTDTEGEMQGGEVEDLSGMKAEGNEDDYLQIGVIMGAHGLRGELRVRSYTDFPEQRFKQPGLRWLKRAGMRKQPLEPVRLVRGRVGPGRPPAWLIRLKGVTSIEQAERLVGASLVVAPEDRPALEEGEFYSPDLIGMRVVLQETGETVGTIEDISTAGGGELLRVRLAGPRLPAGAPTSSGRAEAAPGGGPEGRLVWVPFVEQIVPVVDLDRGLVEITPPAGLLDVGAPSEAKIQRQKKNQELGEQRRLRRKFILARKRYTAAGQLHALAGFKESAPAQQAALIAQLLSIDLRELEAYLREALPEQAASGQGPLPPPSIAVEPPPAFPRADWDALRAWLKTKETPSQELGGEQNPSVESTASQNPVPKSAIEEDPRGHLAEDQNALQGSPRGPSPVTKSAAQTRRWWERGLEMVSQGRVATVVLAGGQGTRLGPDGPPAKGMLSIGLPSGKSLFQLQAERLRRVQDLAAQAVPGSQVQIPWLVLTSEATDEPTRTFFSEHAHFGLDPEQVWFMKQKSLPCVAAEPTQQGQRLLLLAEPHRVAESPGGNGAVFEALHSSGTLEKLKKRGVEFVQVYAVDNAMVKVADPVFFGYCSERNAEVGIKVVTKTDPWESVGVLCLRQTEALGSSDQSTASGVGLEPSSASSSGSASGAGQASGLESGTGATSASGSQPGIGSEEVRRSGGVGKSEQGGGREGRYYSVLEYSEMDDELRNARVGTRREEKGNSGKGAGEGEAGVKGKGKLRYRAAHICINMFSVSFLEKVATNEKLRLPYHAAHKRIPFVEKVPTGEWRRVEPESPNGLKLEQFIFDAFRHADPNKVAILEVERAEEFAPVKNASRPGGIDTPDTAREQILALHQRIVESQCDKTGVDIIVDSL